MSGPVSTRKLSQWMAADQAAHAAAKRLLQRRMAHLNGHGPAPDVNEERDLERLRAEASRLYAEARQEFDNGTAPEA